MDGGGIERRECTLRCQAETLLRLKQTDAHSLSPTHTDARTHPRIPQPRPDPPEVTREEKRDKREIQLRYSVSSPRRARLSFMCEPISGQFPSHSCETGLCFLFFSRWVDRHFLSLSLSLPPSLSVSLSLRGFSLSVVMGLASNSSA